MSYNIRSIYCIQTRFAIHWNVTLFETLHANTVWTTNTIRDPERIVPVKSDLKIKGERTPYVVPPYSIQVMEVELKK